jgi:hypothetical protein
MEGRLSFFRMRIRKNFLFRDVAFLLILRIAPIIAVLIHHGIPFDQATG